MSAGQQPDEQTVELLLKEVRDAASDRDAIGGLMDALGDPTCDNAVQPSWFGFLGRTLKTITERLDDATASFP